MSRLMTLLWLFQGLFLLMVAIQYLFLPIPFYELFHTVSLSRVRDEGSRGLLVFADAIVAIHRMIAPLALASALFSVHAAMREDESARRTLARGFAFHFIVWCVSMAFRLEKQPELHRPEAHLFTVVLGVFAFFNLIYAIAPRFRSEQRALSGTANTRPPQLFVLWLVQGVILLGLAGFVMSLPYLGSSVSEGIYSAFYSNEPTFDRHALAPYIDVGTLDVDGTTPVTPLPGRLVANEFAVIAPFLVGMALMTFYGMRVSREWVWRLVSAIFGITYGTLMLVFIFVWSPDMFMDWVLWAMLALLGSLAYMNQYFARQKSEYITSDIGQGPDGWTVSDLFGGPAMALATFLSGGRRAIHAQGVGLRGRFVVDDDPVPPDASHEVFVPRRLFTVVGRFSNLSSDDDAVADVRAIAIRLQHGSERPIDLSFVTGAFCEFANMAELWTGAVKGRSRLLGWLFGASSPAQRREAALAGLRRGPSSYALLSYYTQIVRFWVDRRGVRRLVRYRIVPGDPEPVEPGLIGIDDLAKRGRLPSDTRSPDYLRREIRRRLEAIEPTVLRLEAQFHTPAVGDGLQWFNAAVDWPAGDHPWHRLGSLYLEQSLPEAVTETLMFSPANHPPSLGIPSSTGPWDPRSLADSERRVVPRVQALRRWMNGAFGVPGSRAKMRPGRPS